MVALTQEKFLEKANYVHNYKYDYSPTIYTLTKNNILINCTEHGIFEQSAGNHLAGKGCKYCANNVKQTVSDFFKKAFEKHNDKYSYEYVNYIDRNTNVMIYCNTCNTTFEQSPKAHIQGQGCSRCSGNYKRNHREWLDVFYAKHLGFYDYSMMEDISEYVKDRKKLDIICPIHGVFQQFAKKHMTSGCKQCGDVSRNIKNEFRRYKNKLTYLYYVKINDLFKIGLTQSSVEERFKYHNINLDIIEIWKFEDGFDALCIEQTILFKTYGYRIEKDQSPIDGGWTELRTNDILDVILIELELFKKGKKCI